MMMVMARMGVAGTGSKTTVEANTLALALERQKQSSESSSHGAEEDEREEVLPPSGGWTEGPRCEDEGRGGQRQQPQPRSS